MARKTNPENDPVGSPASAAPARARRVSTPARPQHSTPSAETPATPVREQETRRGGVDTSARADTVAVDRELAHEEIARLAYALWEARGCQGGSPEEDWLRAEQRLKQGA